MRCRDSAADRATLSGPTGEWLGDEVARVNASTHLARRRQRSVGLAALRECYNSSCEPEDRQYSQCKKLVRPDISHWTRDLSFRTCTTPHQSKPPEPRQQTQPCPANLSSKPLRVSTQCSHHFLNPSPDNKTSRQAHRPPKSRRAQGLLRQRAYLPLMAQLHRHPRRPRRRSSQFR